MEKNVIFHSLNLFGLPEGAGKEELVEVAGDSFTSQRDFGHFLEATWKTDGRFDM